MKAYYPTQEQIEQWISKLHRRAEQLPFEAEILKDKGWRNNYGAFHMRGNRIVQFKAGDMRPYYASFQPPFKAPAPLLVHLPGYGAEISVHPELVERGFNVLSVSPLGYWTPRGFDVKIKEGQPDWPVTMNTLRGLPDGYDDWLTQAILAVKWALTQPQVMPDRLSFYGTSQGGSMAILLASIFAEHGVRCAAANQPYLCDVTTSLDGACHNISRDIFGEVGEQAWHRVGYVDCVSHAYRCNFPTLVSAGTKDTVCLPHTAQTLFDSLPNTRSLTWLKDFGHGYNEPFIKLAASWFELFA